MESPIEMDYDTVIQIDRICLALSIKADTYIC